MTLEEMQQLILDNKTKMEELETKNSALETEISEKNKREKELMEHNQKLFLSVTSNKPLENDNENIEIPFCIDEEMYKQLNKKDIDILNDLIEEEE